MPAVDIVRGQTSGNSGATATATTSITVTAPAGVASGDQLLLGIILRDTPGTAWNPPAGWTLQGSPTQSKGACYFYRATYGTDVTGTSWVFNAGASNTLANKFAWGCIALKGTTVAALLSSVSGADTTAATTHAAGALTTAAASYLVAIFGDRASGTTWTWPSGWVEEVDTQATGTNATSLAIGVDDTTPEAAGTYSVTVTPSASDTAWWGLFSYAQVASSAAATAAGSIVLSGTATASTLPAAGSFSGSITLGGSASPGANASAAGSITLGGSAGPIGALYPSGTLYPSDTLYPGDALSPVLPPPVVVVVPLPPIGVVGAPRWTWALGPWTGLPQQELPHATARSIKMRLTGTSEASFTVDGTTADAASVQELVSDLWVMRNGVTLFRGRFGPSSDDMDGTRHTSQFTVGDYRAVLQRRLLFDADTLTYTSTEQASIAWGLISTTQGASGGDLNITNASTATGTARTITYPAGQSVGQAIEQLALMDSGFNWDILPTTGSVGQKFTTWVSRGINRGKVLDYPGRLTSARRAVDPGAYANAVRETGNTGLAAVRAEASDIATRPEGRWDSQVGDTGLLNAASVTARANYDLAQSQQIVPTWTVTMRPGTWGGPTDLWLGDFINLRVLSGRLSVNESLQVFEIDLDLDDAGNETVTLTLSALDPFKRRRMGQVDYRLSKLERR